MEMPRARSSGRRSVSFPVSARTSHVFPWSMCPAVPTVSGISGGSGWRPRDLSPGCGDGAGDLFDLVVRDRPAVEEEQTVAHDAHDRRLRRAKRRRELLLEGAGVALDLCERKGAAAGPSDRLLDPAVGKPSQPFGPGSDQLGGLGEHAQHGWSTATAVEGE